MYYENIEEENIEEIVDVTLHAVSGFKTANVITVYYPKVVSFDSASQMWELIQNVLKSNNLTLSDVSVFYYGEGSYSQDQIYEWIFDHYLNHFVGDRIEFIHIADLSEDIKTIHKKMCKKIQGR